MIECAFEAKVGLDRAKSPQAGDNGNEEGLSAARARARARERERERERECDKSAVEAPRKHRRRANAPKSSLGAVDAVPCISPRHWAACIRSMVESGFSLFFKPEVYIRKSYSRGGPRCGVFDARCGVFDASRASRGGTG